MAAARRTVRAMIQSVDHMHSHGIVHGDLKLENWLWDQKHGLPCVCDFETAKERGAGSVSTPCVLSSTGPILHTRGYVAPHPSLAPSGNASSNTISYA